MAAIISVSCCCGMVSDCPGACPGAIRCLGSCSATLRTSSRVLGQAGSRCSTSPAMLQLPPPARRAMGEEGELHEDADHSVSLAPGRAGSPPADPVWLILLLAVLHGQVYRFCTLEGTWLLKENSSLPWRNLSECEPSDQVSVFPIFLPSCSSCLGQSRREEKKIVDAHAFLSCQNNPR